METRLTRTCEQLRPGITFLLLLPVPFIGCAIGCAVGAFIEGPIALIAIFVGTYGLPILVGYIHLRDGRLSDDDCRDLLDAAETPSEKARLQEIYCEKGYLMKSDVNRILAWVQQRQHADLLVRMRGAR